MGITVMFPEGKGRNKTRVNGYLVSWSGRIIQGISKELGEADSEDL